MEKTASHTQTLCSRQEFFDPLKNQLLELINVFLMP